MGEAGCDPKASGDQDFHQSADDEPEDAGYHLEDGIRWKTSERHLPMPESLGLTISTWILIVGLPGEGIEEVEHTMQEVLSLDPDSITVHSLAIKRGHVFNLFKDEYKEMTFTNNQRIMEMTEQYAAKAGMFPYYLYRQKNMKGNF